MVRILLLPALLGLGFATTCSNPHGRSRRAAAQAPAVTEVATRTPVDAGAAVTPPADVPVTIRPRPLVTPITPRMLASMRAIAARDPSLRPEVFSKMGGSSVVNHGFLHCFEDEPAIDFRGRPLDETLAYFRAARVGSHTPFARSSVAAAVGWSIRHALGGRPSYVVQEVRATQARWALAFFGSNDVEGKNAHQFAGRLDRLVMTLSERGVVPVLGATYPRRANDPEMNEQVRRYNRMSSAIAAAWGLTYVDFHQPMMTLPGRGLAADGYHPNTYLVGPHAEACDFGEQGLRFGNNHRNLLTMTALDGLRRTMIANEAPPEADRVEPGAGTAEDPVRIASFPFARRFAEADIPGGDADTSTACAGTAGMAHRFVARFTLDRAMRIRASAVAMGPLETHLGIRRVSDATCFGHGEDEEVVSLEPGTYELVAFALRPRRVAEDVASQAPRILVVVDAEP